LDKLHIAECFGAAAAHYDEHAHVQQRILDWSLRNMNVANVSGDLVAKLVDLGSGTGTALPMLASLAETVVAVDIAEPMLDYAQSRNNAITNIQYQCADFDDLTKIFAPNSVDCIFSSMALQWSSSPEQLLMDISHILTVDGRADLTILIAPSFARLRQAWASIGRGHAVHSFTSLAQWQAAAANAGFTFHSNSDVFIDTYPDFLSMLHSIKDVGASTAVDDPDTPNTATLLTKRQLRDARSAFTALNQGQFSLDYHVVQLQLSR
jgi:malonyl-CoA O-methyltransferase